MGNFYFGIVPFVATHLKGRFFVFFTVAFLLFLAHAVGSNPVGHLLFDSHPFGRHKFIDNCLIKISTNCRYANNKKNYQHINHSCLSVSRTTIRAAIVQMASKNLSMTCLCATSWLGPVVVSVLFSWMCTSLASLSTFL